MSKVEELAPSEAVRGPSPWLVADRPHVRGVLSLSSCLKCPFRLRTPSSCPH